MLRTVFDIARPYLDQRVFTLETSDPTSHLNADQYYSPHWHPHLPIRGRGLGFLVHKVRGGFVFILDLQISDIDTHTQTPKHSHTLSVPAHEADHVHQSESKSELEPVPVPVPDHSPTASSSSSSSASSYSPSTSPSSRYAPGSQSQSQTRSRSRSHSSLRVALHVEYSVAVKHLPDDHARDFDGFVPQSDRHRGRMPESAHDREVGRILRTMSEEDIATFSHSIEYHLESTVDMVFEKPMATSSSTSTSNSHSLTDAQRIAQFISDPKRALTIRPLRDQELLLRSSRRMFSTRIHTEYQWPPVHPLSPDYVAPIVSRSYYPARDRYDLMTPFGPVFVRPVHSTPKPNPESSRNRTHNRHFHRLRTKLSNWYQNLIDSDSYDRHRSKGESLVETAFSLAFGSQLTATATSTTASTSRSGSASASRSTPDQSLTRRLRSSSRSRLQSREVDVDRSQSPVLDHDQKQDLQVKVDHDVELDSDSDSRSDSESHAAAISQPLLQSMSQSLHQAHTRKQTPLRKRVRETQEKHLPT